jgi:hypothetical protein
MAKDSTIDPPSRETINTALAFLRLLVARLNEIKPIPTNIAPSKGNTGINQAY